MYVPCTIHKSKGRPSKLWFWLKVPNSNSENWHYSPRARPRVRKSPIGHLAARFLYASFWL
jgi:hypothetical protein